MLPPLPFPLLRAVCTFSISLQSCHAARPPVTPRAALNVLTPTHWGSASPSSVTHNCDSHQRLCISHPPCPARTQAGTPHTQTHHILEEVTQLLPLPRHVCQATSVQPLQDRLPLSDQPEQSAHVNQVLGQRPLRCAHHFQAKGGAHCASQHNIYIFPLSAARKHGSAHASPAGTRPPLHSLL